MSEDVLHFVIHFQTVFAACFCHYVDTTERFDGTSQQFIGLQADNQFVFLVYISGFMRSDGRYGDVVQRTDTIIVSFFFKCFQAEVPDAFGTFSRFLQERGIPSVGCDVFTNEITDIDFFAPKPVGKGFVQFHKFILLVG